jgi:Xaa-Pro aminopeptidase
VSFADRRQQVLDSLPDDIGALLVSTPGDGEGPNLRYLTGFNGSNGQLLLAKDPIFFTDGRYGEQSSKQVPDMERVIYSGTTKFSDVLAKALADRGVTKLGFEAAHTTVASIDKTRDALNGIELVPTTDLVENVRVKKDPGEIQLIRAAQKIAEQALVSALKGFTNGLELDLALAIEWATRNAGCESMSFDTIVASGPHSALPHARPRREPVDLEGVLLIDMGARGGGYCSDMTRTYLGPRAPEELKKAHAVVVAAVEAACEAVKPGVRGSDVDKVARDVLAGAGLAEHFIHSLGHGVGLEIHEPPTLSPLSESVLEPGMIVTIEPGIYLPGVGGIRVEDLLVVTDDGYDNLTSLPRGPELPI